MSKLQKLLPPPMRRPPKPGHANGSGEVDALTNGNGKSPITDDPGKRLATGAKHAPADLVGWVDERMGATSFLTAMLMRKVPKGTNWFYTLGSATMFAFVVQAITGVFLAMYYTPSPVEAYASITHLTNDVFLGEFVRGMHKWGASVMVILIFVHMARTFFFGAYKYPREINWVIGVVLLILTMTMGFTGYLLPFDQRSYWATIVGVNINGTGPLVGPYLSDFLRAGPEFGATTLSRFYAIHIAILPALFTVLLGLHLLFVQRQGMHEPEYVAALPPEKKKMLPFFPNFMLRDVLLWLVVLNVLLCLAVFFPWELGEKADPFASAPAGIRPEWYFMFMFQTLKLIPAHVFFLEGEVLGVVAFGLAGLAWFLVPFWGSRVSPAKRRPAMMIVGVVAIVYIVILTAMGYLM